MHLERFEQLRQSQLATPHRRPAVALPHICLHLHLACAVTSCRYSGVSATYTWRGVTSPVPTAPSFDGNSQDVLCSSNVVQVRLHANRSAAPLQFVS